MIVFDKLVAALGLFASLKDSNHLIVILTT